ncbi:type II toxin-antitoxin system RelE/ParE family toxin [Roseiarcus fermentans]|uniref:type II toxin-antitoxin system RelE/ParE family toxin n=1 Tax=Roseiarcus fermentans TaxID=1473586 RepID=UPI00315DC71A
MQVTPRAERQLDALHRYIADHGGERRADGYIARIVDFCIGLTTFPLRGQATICSRGCARPVSSVASRSHSLSPRTRL